MRDLEDRLNASSEEFHAALAELPLASEASLKRRLRRRQLRRRSVGAVALMGAIVAAAGLVPSPANDVDASNSPTVSVTAALDVDPPSTSTTDGADEEAVDESIPDGSIPDGARLVTMELESLTSDEVASRLQDQLGNGPTLVPTHPVSQDQLESTLQEALLRWPAVIWEGPSEPIDPTGRRVLTASLPQEDRVIRFLVKERADGWFVSDVFPDMTGNEAGFDSETVMVEALRSDLAEPPVLYAARDAWEVVTIPMEAAEATEPMSYLSVGRDEAGRATMIKGWAIETLVSSSPAIGSFEGSDPVSEFSEAFLSSLGGEAVIDDSQTTDRYYRFIDVQLRPNETPGEVYLFTKNEREEVCLRVVDDTGSIGSCLPAPMFDQQGIVIDSRRLDGEGWVVWVLPDTIGLGDLVDAEVDPSGRMFFSTTYVRSDFEVIDGVLALR